MPDRANFVLIKTRILENGDYFSPSGIFLIIRPKKNRFSNRRRIFPLLRSIFFLFFCNRIQTERATIHFGKYFSLVSLERVRIKRKQIPFVFTCVVLRGSSMTLCCVSVICDWNGMRTAEHGYYTIHRTTFFYFEWFKRKNAVMCSERMNNLAGKY